MAWHLKTGHGAKHASLPAVMTGLSGHPRRTSSNAPAVFNPEVVRAVGVDGRDKLGQDAGGMPDKAWERRDPGRPNGGLERIAGEAQPAGQRRWIPGHRAWGARPG